MTGTCLLQTNIHRFSQYREDPTCKLCKQQEEDIFHMLLCCPLLTDIRLNSFKVLRDFFKYHIGDETWENSFSAKEDPVQLMIDSRKFSHLFDISDIILEIEKHSRNLCYKQYNKRLSHLPNLEDGEWLPGRYCLICGNIFLKFTALKLQTNLPCYQGCS